MRILVGLALLLTHSCLFNFVQADESKPDAQTEAREIERWRAERLAHLTSDTGWLTLVGLYWLKEGDNTFGSAKSNALVLEHPALPPTIGSFVLHQGRVQFLARPGSTVTHDNKAVTALTLVPDTAEEPTILAVGSLRFFAIERGGRMGVRVRDTNHPARKSFKGIDYYAVNNDWLIDARFEPYASSKRIPIVNILGMTEDMQSPGAIVFRKDGKEYRLDALLESPQDTELFVMFADATTGRETYGAGRFMYVPLPASQHVRLDFNKAYNPPCAFSEFATCPLPPPQNRLELRVESGEKKFVPD